MANEPAFLHEINGMLPDSSYTSDNSFVGSHSMYLSSDSESSPRAPNAITFAQQLLTPEDFQGQTWSEDSDASEDDLVERMLESSLGTQPTPQNLIWSSTHPGNSSSAALLPSGSSHLNGTGRAGAERIIDFRTYFEETQSRTAHVRGPVDPASQVIDHWRAPGSQLYPPSHVADPRRSLPMSSVYQLPGSYETPTHSSTRLANHAAGISMMSARWRNGQSSEQSAFGDAINETIQKAQPLRSGHYTDEYTGMSLGQSSGAFPPANPGAEHHSGYPADHDVFYS